MEEKIIILDFGSQYTQLIARRVRELNVYCEIWPYNTVNKTDRTVRGVILSGSPFSVRDDQAPIPDLSKIKGSIPLLGICYGAQYLCRLSIVVHLICLLYYQSARLSAKDLPTGVLSLAASPHRPAKW